MTQLIIRAAQSAFNKAGYQRDEGYRQAQIVAEYMMANLNMCRATYGVEDEFELAYQMARTVAEDAQARRVTLPWEPVAA